MTEPACGEPRYVDICAGYGGLSASLITALGHGRVTHVAEIDPDMATLLERVHPDAPNLGDVRTIDWSALRCTCDGCWWTAGYPCQPWSAAGKRLGADDPRHLWPWIFAGIIAARPAHVLLENVQGHVKKGLPDVLADLESAGYGGAWVVVRASDVGAPHQRARVFVMAHRDAPAPGFHRIDAPRNPSGAVAPLLKTPTAQLAVNGGSQHPDKRRAGGHGPTLADEVEHLLPTPSTRLGIAGPISPELAAERAARGPGLNLDDVAALLQPERWGKYSAAVARWESIWGVTAPAPTVPSARAVRGVVLNPELPEWMMGIPSGVITRSGLSRSAQLRGIGNGVCPPQGAYGTALLLRATLGVDPFRAAPPETRAVSDRK